MPYPRPERIIRLRKKFRKRCFFFGGGGGGGGATDAVPVPVGGRAVGGVDVSGVELAASTGVGGVFGTSWATFGGVGLSPAAGELRRVGGGGTSDGLLVVCDPGNMCSSGFLASAKCLYTKVSFNWRYNLQNRRSSANPAKLEEEISRTH
jgi:hypothetical protein